MRPPSPAELQLKEKTPCQQPPACWPDAMLDGEMRNGLLCVNNPLRYTDPSGHWGQEAADWWSGTVGSGANYISASPSHWIYNGTVGTVNSLVGGVAEPLRLGSSAGAVSGNPNATAGQIAIASVQETARAAALIPVGAAIGKGAGTLLGAGGKEAAGGLAGAGANLKYHYTTSPESSFKTGLREQSSVTDNPNLTAKQAVEQLGVKTPPNKVIPIQDQGNFVPNKPAVVQEHFNGPGGGKDFTNPQRVPPSQILPAKPVKPEN